MAKVWPVFDGNDGSASKPWAVIPFEESVDLFNLQKEDLIPDLKNIPRFGSQKESLWFLGYKNVVVEVDSKEARKAKWSPGYYRIRAASHDVFSKLLKRVIDPIFGEGRILRVEHGRATTSQGDSTIKVTVVLADNAIRELPANATLDALVTLQDELRKMSDEGMPDQTPIVEYVTEAELE